MKDTFAGFHPVVNFSFFAAVLLGTMFFMHPACLAISLLSAAAYGIYLGGGKAVRFQLCGLLPLLLITALLNPAFNHAGATILTYLPTGNPLTLESIVYGFAAAAMLAAVICWFSCYNQVMTSDKFVYLFGRVIPSLSLVLSMTLRFVPKFRAQIRQVSESQRCVGRDVSNGSVLQRAKNGLTILSIMLTWCMENAIETADSMKSRGYGLSGRTAFSIYRFDRRDRNAMLFLLLAIAFIAFGAARGALSWRYFPEIAGAGGSALSVSVLLTDFALCNLPLAVNLAADHQWKRLEKAEEK